MLVVMTVTSCNPYEVIDMAKVKLQVTIEGDVKKNLAKLAIDKEKTMSELVEEALQKTFFSNGNLKSKNP